MKHQGQDNCCPGEQAETCCNIHKTLPPAPLRPRERC